MDAIFKRNLIRVLILKLKQLRATRRDPVIRINSVSYAAFPVNPYQHDFQCQGTYRGGAWYCSCGADSPKECER